MPAGREKESEPLPSLADPVQTIAWGGRLPSQRRAVLGALAGLGIGAPLVSQYWLRYVESVRFACVALLYCKSWQE